MDPERVTWPELLTLVAAFGSPAYLVASTIQAWILGRAPQLALVAAQRLPVDEVLDAGTLVLGGDVDLANVVLRTMRAYV